jgi:hypothetical protein
MAATMMVACIIYMSYDHMVFIRPFTCFLTNGASMPTLAALIYVPLFFEVHAHYNHYLMQLPLPAAAQFVHHAKN